MKKLYSVEYIRNNHVSILVDSEETIETLKSIGCVGYIPNTYEIPFYTVPNTNTWNDNREWYDENNYTVITKDDILELHNLPEEYMVCVNDSIKDANTIMEKVYGEKDYFQFVWKYVRISEYFWGNHLHDVNKTNLPEYTYNDWLYLFNKKQNTMQEEKKLIGYKLIKPEYEQAYKTLTNTSNLTAIECRLNELTWVKEAVQKLKEAGVLELWFEPVYEEVKFKVGDWVYGKNLGCHIYNDGDHPVEILEIVGNEFIYNLSSNPNQNLFKDKEKSNRYSIKTITKKATEEEIKKIKENFKTIFRIGGEKGFDLTIKKDGIFHKSENITKYVESLYKLHNTQNFDNYGCQDKREGYDFIVKDIVLSKTGCENKESMLSEWKECYEKYLTISK